MLEVALLRLRTTLRLPCRRRCSALPCTKSAVKFCKFPMDLGSAAHTTDVRVVLVRLGARTSDAIVFAKEVLEARQLSDRIWKG
jgi:hypothetical protein